MEDYKDYDKSIFGLSRHSGFMIMHTFTKWGNTGHNMAGSPGITTVSITKAHGKRRRENSLVARDYLE